MLRHNQCMDVTIGRRLAARALMAVDAGAWAADWLRQAFESDALPPVERRLATSLTLGVLRRRAWLDDQIQARLQGGAGYFSRLDPPVLHALRLGAYQLGWLNRMPRAVVIDQAVESVKLARLRSAAALVNAVLRRMDGAQLAQPPAATPSLDDASWRAWLSHPGWLLEHWRNRWGETSAIRMAEWNLRAPGETICDPAGQSALGEPGAWVSGSRRLSPEETRNFQNSSAVWLQNEASQFIALLPGYDDDQPGVAWVEACAAPGGKAAASALRQPHRMVIGLEKNISRAHTMRQRYPAANLHVVVADALRPWPLRFSPSRILLDAPCSGTGTLGRNPDLKWRLRPEDPARLAMLQHDLLSQALRGASPGARVVYSVCSLEAIEGEDLIRNILLEFPAWRLIDSRKILTHLQNRGAIHHVPADLILDSGIRILPGAGTGDGFFAAVLEAVA